MIMHEPKPNLTPSIQLFEIKMVFEQHLSLITEILSQTFLVYFFFFAVFEYVRTVPVDFESYKRLSLISECLISDVHCMYAISGMKPRSMCDQRHKRYFATNY